MRRHHPAQQHVRWHNSLATKDPAVGSRILLYAGACAEPLINRQKAGHLSIIFTGEAGVAL